MSEGDVRAEHAYCEACNREVIDVPVGQPDGVRCIIRAFDLDGRPIPFDRGKAIRYTVGAQGRWHVGENPRWPGRKFFASTLFEAASGRWFGLGAPAATEADWQILVARGEGTSEYVELTPVEALDLLKRSGISLPPSLKSLEGAGDEPAMLRPKTSRPGLTELRRSAGSPSEESAAAAFLPRSGRAAGTNEDHGKVLSMPEEHAKERFGQEPILCSERQVCFTLGYKHAFSGAIERFYREGFVAWYKRLSRQRYGIIMSSKDRHQALRDRVSRKHRVEDGPSPDIECG